MKATFYSRAIRVLPYLAVLVAIFFLASAFTSAKDSVFFNELNSHRKAKLTLVYEQDTQDFAETVAAKGYIWHDSLRPADHAEIVLTDTIDRSDYKLFYSSLTHRTIMMDERFDYISIGVADGFWYYGSKGKVTRKVKARYFVARFWQATEEELKGMSKKELMAHGYEKYWGPKGGTVWIKKKR